MKTVVVWTLLLAASVASQPVPGHEPLRVSPPGQLSAEQRAAFEQLASADPEGDAASRRQAFRSLLASPDAHGALESLLDEKLAGLERRYAQLLHEPVRAAYRKTITSLGAKDMRQVAYVRRVWRNYIVRPSGQKHFQKHFLVPATKVCEMILPDVAAVRSSVAKEQLQRMREIDRFRTELREALELGDDPTTKKFSPTGIEMPPLTEPRDFDEQLDHLQRTIALASSIAPEPARRTLIENAVKARFIDLQEAEFVLYANEIRMLVGSVAWSTDIMACAATRDHSKDRADGNASGHMSKLPGKRGFNDRLRRFGTRMSSEGAGGGKHGRGYLHGLSYGGGHTGPLYALKRTRVGCGRYGGVYTSVYGGGGDGQHPCDATNGTTFMPPGFTREDVGHETLGAAYDSLQKEDYIAAGPQLKDAEAETKTDEFMRRYLRLALKVESDWHLESLQRIIAAGDLRAAGARMQLVYDLFGEELDRGFRRIEKRLNSSAGERTRAAGLRYALACRRGDLAELEAVIESASGTVYAEAAKLQLQAARAAGKKELDPYAFFFERDVELARFEYPGQ